MTSDDGAGPVSRVAKRADAPIGPTPPAARRGRRPEPEVTEDLRRRLRALARVRETATRLNTSPASIRPMHAALELVDVVEVLDLVDQLMRSLAYDGLVDPGTVRIGGLAGYHGPRPS